jgi:predicted ArsR family transcriptional regulator
VILSDIKRYLMQRGQASLGDIALHFDSPPEAVRGMLEQWMRKGKVRRHMATSACGGSCNKCDLSTTEIYEWIGSGRPAGSRQSVPIPDSCSR